MKKSKLKLLASYDECDLMQIHADYLEESWEPEEEGEEKPSKEVFFNKACQDSDFLSFEWDFVIDELSTWLNQQKTTNFKAKGENMGWQNRTGEKEIIINPQLETDTGSQFLAQLLPKTDCTFYIYRFRNGLKVINSHHDAPTGETYFIKPFNKKEQAEYEKQLY